MAQNVDERPAGPPPAALAEPRQAAAMSGPTIYVVDQYRHLASIDLGTKAVHIIATVSPSLTDIGFDPINHQLYGVSFTSFYSVNKTTGATHLVGSLGVSDANSLVFNSSGTCYSAGVNSGGLYRIAVTTGKVTKVGATGGFGSAGDLVFYNGHLVLSAFQGTGSIGPSTTNYLVELSEKTGAHEGSSVLLPLKELYGLVSTGTNQLFGLALLSSGTGAGLYQIVPSATTTAKRAVLLANLTSKGLGQIYGAAYDGNYQP